MKTIKFDMFVTTCFVGSRVADEGEIEVPDDSTEEFIEQEIESYTRDWMFEQIDWGFKNVTEETA